MNFRIGIVSLCVILLCACDKGGSPSAEKTEIAKPSPATNVAITLENAIKEGAGFHSNADGSGYIYGDYGETAAGIWYVRGAEAVRVREVPQLSEKQSVSATLPTLIPFLQQSLKQEKEKVVDLQSELKDAQSNANGGN